MKAFTPFADIVKAAPFAAEAGEAMIRFIGYSELAGAIGVILPAATRIMPKLTPLAAAGLLVIMILATAHHAARGEMNAVPVTLGIGTLAAFVAWGRWKKVPLRPGS
jgi:hypothetical protein